MGISEKQIHLINLVKKYLNNLKNSEIDQSKSSQCYFPLWDENPGQARVKLWDRGWIYSFKYFYINLKYILAIASHAEYEEIENNKQKNKAKILVISWAFKNGFQSDGSYNDKYFNENTESLKDSLWLLISMDDYVPNNLKDNLRVLKLKKGYFKYNFFSFFKILINTFIKYNFSFKKVFHYLSSHTYFANQISQVLKRELKKNIFNTVLMPYEGQPFQHTVYSEAKKHNNKMLTLGYMHSMPTPLPCEHIFREGAPDFLYLHGSSQVEIFKSKLNWPENRLRLIKSLRFRVENKKSFSNKIFLPLTLQKTNILIDLFKNFLSSCPTKNFQNLEVMNHPIMLNSAKHVFLKKNLEKLMQNYKDKFSLDSENTKTTIFFGVSGGIFEALERGNEVIHICSNPLFESFNKEIWVNLKIEKINDFIFQYNLESKKQYINFGNKDDSIANVLETLTKIE